MAPQEIDLVLPGFALSVRGQDGYTIMTISSELDIASVPVLRDQIPGQLDGVLRLAAPTPVAAALLRLTGLDWRFEIFATVPDAIGAPVHGGAGEAGAPQPRAC